MTNLVPIDLYIEVLDHPNHNAIEAFPTKWVPSSSDERFHLIGGPYVGNRTFGEDRLIGGMNIWMSEDKTFLGVKYTYEDSPVLPSGVPISFGHSHLTIPQEHIRVALRKSYASDLSTMGHHFANPSAEVTAYKAPESFTFNEGSQGFRRRGADEAKELANKIFGELDNK